MKLLKADTKVPIYTWTEDIDEDTLQQVLNIANLPFAYHHVALMPDAHVGYGMPIGGVLATEGVVIPNCVGVDIGCGMKAIETNLTVKQIKPELPKILNQIQRDIPTGFNWNKRPQENEVFDRAPDIPIIQQQLDRARKQICSLGGGNHFIEIQKDKDGNIWVMLHSGSRNIGKQIADVYYKVAKAKLASNKKVAKIYPSVELAFLEMDSTKGQEYFEAMSFALDFAYENRRMMMERIKNIIADFFPLEIFEEVNIHHNYAAKEKHFGKEVYVHRKGATSARKGQVGIIPGSMGTASYIVEGLGNEMSFESCSHGSGRRLGRREAKRKIKPHEVIEEMREKDILLYKARKGNVAEECSAAYKDIEDVMDKQMDLVKIKVKLWPVGVVKG